MHEIIRYSFRKEYPVGVIAELSLLPFFPLQDIVFPGHTFVVVGKEKNKYIVGEY
jgi:hypothetical protein